MTVVNWLLSADTASVIQFGAILATLLSTYLACHPILAFIRRGWAIKRDDIVSSLNDNAKKLYLQTFLKEEAKNPRNDFDRMYTHRYGRYRLTVPTVLLVLVLLTGTFCIAETAAVEILQFNHVKISPAGLGFTLPLAAVGALAGSYTWVVYGLISNAAQYNLPPPFVLAATLRIIASVPLGYAIGALAEPNFGVFLAFAVGVFPLGTVQTILQRIATKQLKLDIGLDPTLGTDDQVVKLDGIDPPTADRLQDAGITTVPQLAYCDPVQLSMLTNIRFDAVVDMVDQALARIYLGDSLNEVRPYGLRGAMEVSNLLSDLNGADVYKREAAQKTLAACALATKLDADGLKNAFAEMSGDPYTVFLNRIWEGVGDL